MYNNTGYPHALLLAPDPPKTFDTVGIQLAQFARPSFALLDAVNCVRDECALAADNNEAQQACQCASWILACQVAGDDAAPQTKLFCGQLSAGNTACSAVSAELVSALATTSSGTVLNACFGDRK